MPPTGGPKDTAAPLILNSTPDSAGLNFKGQILSFTFNEFVEMKDAGAGIFISPPIKTPPVATLNGKTLKLNFEEPFDSNTTYQVNFSKSISDLTEGNPLKDASFVFSTGNIIDSLEFSGVVADGFTNKFVKDVLVMLYTQPIDSLPLKELPRYFARSGEGGKFTISNIKPGKYKSFALVDGNKNYLFDQAEEKIGFIENDIEINKKINNGNDFRIFQNPSTIQKLIRKKFNQPARISLKYSVPVDAWKINWISPAEGLPVYMEEYLGKDSLVAALGKTDADSIVFVSEVYLNGISKLDTIKFEPNKSKKITGKKGGNNKLNADTLIKLNNNLELGKLRIGDTLIITGQSPFSKINKKKITIKIDGKAIEAPVVAIDSGKAIKAIPFSNLTVAEKETNLLFIPGAFEDIYGRINDTVKIAFKPFEIDDLGTLLLTVKLDSTSYPLVLELLNKEGKIVDIKKCKNNDVLFFDKLIPGNYSARIIIDKNNNGKWDSGNYFQKIQPENMIFFSGEIVVRPGWDLELIIKN
jgi:hypothetical protein